MPFNLFRKKKQQNQEQFDEPTKEAVNESTEEETQQSTVTQETEEQKKQIDEPEKEATKTVEEQTQEQNMKNEEQEHNAAQTPKPEIEKASKTYLKAMPLKELSDVEKVKNEVNKGNIIILRVTPLAGKNIEEVKCAVNELFQFTESINGDIARLGEERVVICPKSIRIWREKTPSPVSS